MTEPFDPGRKPPPDWDHLDKYPLEPHLRALGTGPVPSDAILGITCPKLYDQGQTPKCFPAGTLVAMADGSERPIEDIRAGESVLTHTGSEHMVEAVMARRHSGEMVQVKVRGTTLPLVATPEHPFMVTTQRRHGEKVSEWVPLGDVAVSQRHGIRTFLHLDPGAPSDPSRIGDALDLLDVLPEFLYTDTTVRWFGGRVGGELPRYIELTEQFAWLVGLYLAEGSAKTTGGDWTLSLSDNEHDLADEAIKALQVTFGVQGYKQQRPNHCMIVHAGSTALGRLFHALCGQGAENKRFHSVMARWEPALLRAVWDGFAAGDGYQRHDVHRNLTDLVTVSPRLARDLWRAGMRCGLNPTIRGSQPKISNNVKSRRYRWDVCAYGDKNSERRPVVGRHTLCAVESVETTPYEGLVYNLEVEEDHSYIADGFVVHNCVGYGTATLTTAMEYKNEKQWTAQKYDADAAYAWANANDGIPGAHDGSTTRAGFEYLRQQGAHITRRTRLRPNEPIDHKITQYLWAKTLDQLLQFMWAEQLPGMIGINWYNDMFNPDANGFIKPTGGLAGGHNLTVRGFSMTEEYVILRNSWNGWGLNNTGDAKVRFADMTKLLSQDGEAGAPVDIIGA